MAEAFRLLHQAQGPAPCRLRISGWLGENQRAYFDDVRGRLKQAGLAAHVEHVPAPDHVAKVRFLQSLDVLSVPTVYREPKGLYVLEALANGVPVVQPRHGSFPELIAATGGGLLCNPEDPEDLARSLRQLQDNQAHREELGRKGKEAVHQRFHAARMAQETVSVYQHHLH